MERACVATTFLFKIEIMYISTRYYKNTMNIGEIEFGVGTIIFNNTEQIVLFYNEYVVAVIYPSLNRDYIYFDIDWAELLFATEHPEFLNFNRYDNNHNQHAWFDEAIAYCDNLLADIQAEYDPILEFDENNVFVLH